MRLAVSLAAVAAAGLAACSPRPAVVATDPRAFSQLATIRRDTFGVPHILADSEEAAAFALGYAQAEDHAVEIARRYVRGRGEAARYFGEDALEADLEMAQFDNLAEARRGLAQLSPEFLRIITAFVAGVNRYVERHRSSLPEWIPVFEPADVLAHSRAGAVNALAGPAIPRQLEQKLGGGKPRGSGDDDGGLNEWIDTPGSNAFALAGSRTTTGKPILLGNPHLTWASLYWEAHIRVPGRIDFYGSTLAGIPVLRAGFNDRLGFVTTNNDPDLDDVFALEVDPGTPDHYRFDGRSMPLTRRDRGAAGAHRGRHPADRDAHLLGLAHRHRRPPHAGADLRRQVDATRRAPLLRRLLQAEPDAVVRRMARRDAREPRANVELHLCRRRRQHHVPVERPRSRPPAGRRLSPRRAGERRA